MDTQQNGRKRTPTFSIALTPSERESLEKRAGGRPLGRYIRNRLFGADAPLSEGLRGIPIKDHEALARVLAELGRSRLAGDLGKLADAAVKGLLEVTPETAEALTGAVANVAQMRSDLLRALGVQAWRSE